MLRLPAAAVLLLTGLLISPGLIAGEIRLSDGTLLRGRIRPLQSLSLASQRSVGELTTYPIVEASTSLKRYFVPSRSVAELNNDADLDRFETFELSTRKSRFSTQVQSLGVPIEVGPFDDFGRRKLVFRMKDRPLNVYQSVTRLTPHHATVVARNLGWTHGIATNALPPDVLDRWLRRVTDASSLDDRLAIARFYLQANMYKQAGGELQKIQRDFPDQQAKIDSPQAKLDELVGQKIIDELKRRRENGQHRLFRAALEKFPAERLSSTIRQQVREMIREDRKQQDQLASAKRLLAGELAAITEVTLRDGLKPLVAEMTAKLDLESLVRLDAFLRFADDTTLSPAEKLALAGSGWLLGAGNAITDPRDATTLLQARNLLLGAVRANEADRSGLVSRMESLEGISPERVSQLISGLPPLVETPAARPGVPLHLTAPDADFGYWILLPPEYNPYHSYPTLVILHDAGGSPRASLGWWAGTEQKPRPVRQRGYILMAPELPGVTGPSTSTPTGTRKNNPTRLQVGPALHEAVRRSLVDARRRFHIDSDRTFLSGHGQGAAATFEIGMSHPDWFAGIIQIAGAMTDYCTYYWANARKLPWYVVNGKLDRPRLEKNAMGLNRMLRHRFPIVYCEYVGRGYESFAEELFAIIDWMDRQKRSKDPRELEVGTLRSSDNRFHWVRMNGLPLTETRGKRMKPLRLAARITPGNSITVSSAARATTLWLSPDLIDFQRRVQIRVNGRRDKSRFLTPSVSDMVADFHQRADREKLYWLRLDFE
ncbi:MAG: hypothetical protein VB859_19555 [Planctomycetaceae bacterium]